MSTIMWSIKNYTLQTGVQLSVFITLFSTSILGASLIGIEFGNESFQTLCFLNFIIEFIYGIIVTLKVLNNNEKYFHLIPFLFLNWFIGCFSTNVLLNIFENLPVWTYVVTFLFCFTNFIIYSKYKSKWVTPISFYLNGTSFLLILYYVIYLIPFTPLSIIGILAIGMGFYGLVPFIVSISHIIILIKTLPHSRQNKMAFGVGIGSVLIGLGLFCYLLNIESEKMTSKSTTKSFESNDDLPSYITISQNLKPTFLNEILLKQSIVYEYNSNFMEFRGLNSFGRKQYNERKTHDPIINLGYIFSKELNLSADDRINILKSNFDKRLETEEQLWSGLDLITKNIKEDIKVYPEERLAYTEITMDVACSKENWGQKEAIYSFQLPEGSVASSLSLWVNGVERKGVLTTKEKAKKAYNQIVAVEARDPSLMQWREGNKVVVRVFPISYEMPRTFKCGFTTPLKFENNTLYYESLSIKGPSVFTAETLSRIQVLGNSKFKSTKDFELENNFYVNKSKGLDKWEASFKIPENKYPNSFFWKNKEYKIVPIERASVYFVPSEIILDLNSSWEIEEVKSLVTNTSKKYYAFLNNEKTVLNTSNIEAVFSELNTLHYSLLPFYKLSKNSLVITKCGDFSANFEELESSKYLQKLKNNTKQKQIRVINIGTEINPFWQTIKEQKYVEYVKSDLKTTIQLLAKNHYPTILSEENIVNIEPSNCAIQESSTTLNLNHTGSNHIYRMYAFGKILEEQVKIQTDTLAHNKYLNLAKEANIVTPISSLIVLETDADYEKQGIEKNINTLGNASIENDGAVPEPHEWAMIILGLIALLYYYKKTKNQVV